ncbi:hypothetical protein QAD02_018869 [Eretmocerus hayati]|uniref:Uncharacterized protein n=1 Tax=Eretmocerus hayati TaxID=131215 RepID=A0ACC2PI84_9HYME|nr:hypothetical protein QAD02_018869 [Eretmocerus hayati]
MNQEGLVEYQNFINWLTRCYNGHTQGLELNLLDYNANLKSICEHTRDSSTTAAHIVSNRHGASYNDIRRMTVMIERIQGVCCHYRAYAVQARHRITASRIRIPVASCDNDENIIEAETDIIEMERQCRLALDEAVMHFVGLRSTSEEWHQKSRNSCAPP